MLDCLHRAALSIELHLAAWCAPMNYFLRSNRIVGTQAMHGHAAYRRTPVACYCGLLNITRPLYNAAACVSP